MLSRCQLHKFRHELWVKYIKNKSTIRTFSEARKVKVISNNVTQRYRTLILPVVSTTLASVGSGKKGRLVIFTGKPDSYSIRRPQNDALIINYQSSLSSCLQSCPAVGGSPVSVCPNTGLCNFTNLPSPLKHKHTHTHTHTHTYNVS